MIKECVILKQERSRNRGNNNNNKGEDKDKTTTTFVIDGEVDIVYKDDFINLTKTVIISHPILLEILDI